MTCIPQRREMLALRITVRSSGGHCRTFGDDKAAGAYAAELSMIGENVLTTIMFPDGDLVEFAALGNVPDNVELDVRRLAMVESQDGIPGADVVAKSLFPHLD